MLLHGGVVPVQAREPLQQQSVVTPSSCCRPLTFYLNQQLTRFISPSLGFRILTLTPAQTMLQA